MLLPLVKVAQVECACIVCQVACIGWQSGWLVGNDSVRHIGATVNQSKPAVIVQVHHCLVCK